MDSHMRPTVKEIEDLCHKWTLRRSFTPKDPRPYHEALLKHWPVENIVQWCEGKSLRRLEFLPGNTEADVQITARILAERLKMNGWTVAFVSAPLGMKDPSQTLVCVIISIVQHIINTIPEETVIPMERPFLFRDELNPTNSSNSVAAQHLLKALAKIVNFDARAVYVIEGMARAGALTRETIFGQDVIRFYNILNYVLLNPRTDGCEQTQKILFIEKQLPDEIDVVGVDDWHHLPVKRGNRGRFLSSVGLSGDVRQR